MSKFNNSDRKNTQSSGQEEKFRGNGGFKRGENPSNTTQKQKRAVYVDRTVLDYRRASKLCLRCGASDHFVPRCPYLPPKRPEIGIKSTNMKVPPMIEEDDEVDKILGEAGKE